MGQIAWKGGVEPEDAAVVQGEGKPMATYTGQVEEPTEEAYIVTHPDPTDEVVPCKLNIEELVQNVGERFAKMNIRRPEPQLHRQIVKAVPKVMPRGGVAVQRLSSGMGYGFARRREAGSTGPVRVILGDNQSVPIMMSLAAAGTTAVPQLIELATDEPKRAEIIPIRIPKTVEQLRAEERQRKAEEFYRQTGITAEELQETFRPTWTIAGVLDPREHARRLSLGVRNCLYDVEITAVKAKNAVKGVLYKKRPKK